MPCSLCGAEGTNKTTCPLNPDIPKTKWQPHKHNVAASTAAAGPANTSGAVKKPITPRPANTSRAVKKPSDMGILQSALTTEPLFASSRNKLGGIKKSDARSAALQAAERRRQAETNAAKMEALSKTTEEGTCPICLEEDITLYSAALCGHRACLDCIIVYWRGQKDAREAFTCLECDTVSTIDQVQHLISIANVQPPEGPLVKHHRTKFVSSDWPPCPFTIQTLTESRSCPGHGRPLGGTRARCNYELCRAYFCIRCRKKTSRGTLRQSIDKRNG